MSRAGLSFVIISLAICVNAVSASAGNVIYLHGRSFTTWPSGGQLAVSPSWQQIILNYDGSARLDDASVRPFVRDRIRAACSATDCVVVCHSAGCARALVAYSDLAALGVPLRVLFTEALGSAAGGSELAQLVSSGGIRLLARLINQLAHVDDDLPPQNMRNGTWSFIQNAAPSPVYHLAGRRNICVKVKAFQATLAGVGTWVGGLVAGPVGGVIGGIGGTLFGSSKRKLCGNYYMPGELGDGVVAVHSAAGYADQAPHGSHADGGPKYVFRAYEQVPLFDQDHVGIFKPGIERGSLRVAVRSVTANQCVNALNASDNGEPSASIVYQDADSAQSTISEAAPIDILQICGNDMFSSTIGPRMYATCNGQGGCCNSFSTGATSGCTCGETLCTQAGLGYISYFTGAGCSGTEYSTGSGTWDGVGMVGASTARVTIQSIRIESGECQATTALVLFDGCSEYRPILQALTLRRVYRPFITGYAFDPQGWNTDPGDVVMIDDRTEVVCP